MFPLLDMIAAFSFLVVYSIAQTHRPDIDTANSPDASKQNTLKIRFFSSTKPSLLQLKSLFIVTVFRLK